MAKHLLKMTNQSSKNHWWFQAHCRHSPSLCRMQKNEFKNALERIDHHIPSLRKILSCLIEGIFMSGPPRSPSWAPIFPCTHFGLSASCFRIAWSPQTPAPAGLYLVSTGSTMRCCGSVPITWELGFCLCPPVALPLEKVFHQLYWREGGTRMWAENGPPVNGLWDHVLSLHFPDTLHHLFLHKIVWDILYQFWAAWITSLFESRRMGGCACKSGNFWSCAFINTD